MTPAFPSHLDEFEKRKKSCPSDFWPSEHTQIYAIGLLLGSVPRQEAWVGSLFLSFLFFFLRRRLAFE